MPQYGSIGDMKPNARDALPSVGQLDNLSRQELQEHFKQAWVTSPEMPVKAS